MDTDGSGDIDFVEFCSYIGSCHDVMEEVEETQTWIKQFWASVFLLKFVLLLASYSVTHISIWREQVKTIPNQKKMHVQITQINDVLQ